MKTTLSPGDRLYKFELKQKIGGGYFGEVWFARDHAVARDVAVKILDESMAHVAANLREAQVGNKLTHDNVVKVHYADVVGHGAGNLVVIAMDHHAKGSIVSLVNAANFIVMPRAVSAIIDVLRGLEYLHEQNLLHNDIKPSNILLGENSQALLTDYGISCVTQGLQPALAPNAYVLHRAPETTASGSIAVATDIYQCGLTLFRLVNGIGLIEEQKRRVGDAEFERLKRMGLVPATEDYMLFVPRALKQIISKATAPAPDDRYRSVLEMRRALERLQFGGFWDVDSAGRYVGYVRNDKFTFVVLRAGSSFSVESYRERPTTGRRTRVTRYCAKGLSIADATALQKRMMLAVVDGSI